MRPTTPTCQDHCGSFFSLFESNVIVIVLIRENVTMGVYDCGLWCLLVYSALIGLFMLSSERLSIQYLVLYDCLVVLLVVLDFNLYNLCSELIIVFVFCHLGLCHGLVPLIIIVLRI